MIFAIQLSAWLMLILIVSFPHTEIISRGDALTASIALLELYGASVTGFVYLCSFALKRSAGAQVAIIFLVLILGFALSIVGVLLRIFLNDLYFGYIRYFLVLFPPFALGEGLQSIALLDYFSSNELEGSNKYNPWDWKCAGLGITLMAIETFVYFAATVMIDYYALHEALLFGQQLPNQSLTPRDEGSCSEKHSIPPPHWLSSIISDPFRCCGGGESREKGSGGREARRKRHHNAGHQENVQHRQICRQRRLAGDSKGRVLRPAGRQWSRKEHPPFYSEVTTRPVWARQVDVFFVHFFPLFIPWLLYG